MCLCVYACVQISLLDVMSLFLLSGPFSNTHPKCMYAYMCVCVSVSALLNNTYKRNGMN